MNNSIPNMPTAYELAQAAFDAMSPEKQAALEQFCEKYCICEPIEYMATALRAAFSVGY